MMIQNFSVIGVAALAAFAILTISMMFAFWRLVKGPSLPDRVVALDLMANLTIGMIFSLVLYTGEIVYLDVAVFIAMIVFLGNVAIARFLKRRVNDQ